MPGTTPGYIQGFGSLTQQAVAQFLANDFSNHSASTDTSMSTNPGRRLLTYSGGVLTITLAAPVSGADDGKRIVVINTTSTQHTVTCTGKLNDGAGHVNTATFPAHPGAAFEIVAYQGAWYLVNNQSVVFS